MIYGGTNGHVFCFDEKNGDEMWRTKLSTGNFLNAASSGDVAVMVKGDILVAGCNGHIWGLDCQTGDVLWHNGLSGLGNSFVSMSDGVHSIQYIHTHTNSTTNS